MMIIERQKRLAVYFDNFVGIKDYRNVSHRDRP